VWVRLRLAAWRFAARIFLDGHLLVGRCRRMLPDRWNREQPVAHHGHPRSPALATLRTRRGFPQFDHFHQRLLVIGMLGASLGATPAGTLRTTPAESSFLAPPGV